MATKEINNDNKPFLSDLRKDFVTLFKNTDPIEAVQELLNSLPSAAAILNPQREAIFVNQHLLNSLGFSSLENLFGKRPGEMLNCLHALENENQCGVSESCKLCGALQAIRETLSKKSSSFSEMRLTSVRDGIPIARDLKIVVSPLFMNNKVYMILFLNDISNEKRRLALERIFFHDVLNKISSLSGLTQILQKEDKIEKYKNYIHTIGIILNDLTGEIRAQQQLSAAESGELIVNHEQVNLSELIAKVVAQMEQLYNPKNAVICIDSKSQNITLTSDQILLNRIITNLIKNALEASKEGEQITVSTSLNGKNIVISVHNNSYIHQDIQLQIFQRSFSTKGSDRGLGTYSVKLLTERYLGGKAYFISTQKDGTTFYIDIPMKDKN